MESLPSRYDNVCFRFLFDKEVENIDLYGQVLFRDGGMVLDIPRGGETPYLLHGKPCRHWFEGGNAAVNGNPVEAKWALVGATYVGTWTETGDTWLFSFSIDPAAAVDQSAL